MQLTAKINDAIFIQGQDNVIASAMTFNQVTISTGTIAICYENEYQQGNPHIFINSDIGEGMKASFSDTKFQSIQLLPYNGPSTSRTLSNMIKTCAYVPMFDDNYNRVTSQTAPFSSFVSSNDSRYTSTYDVGFEQYSDFNIAFICNKIALNNYAFVSFSTHLPLGILQAVFDEYLYQMPNQITAKVYLGPKSFDASISKNVLTECCTIFPPDNVTVLTSYDSIPTANTATPEMIFNYKSYPIGSYNNIKNDVIQSLIVQNATVWLFDKPNYQGKVTYISTIFSGNLIYSGSTSLNGWFCYRSFKIFPYNGHECIQAPTFEHTTDSLDIFTDVPAGITWSDFVNSQWSSDIDVRRRYLSSSNGVITDNNYYTGTFRNDINAQIGYASTESLPGFVSWLE